MVHIVLSIDKPNKYEQIYIIPTSLDIDHTRQYFFNLEHLVKTTYRLNDHLHNKNNVFTMFTQQNKVSRQGVDVLNVARTKTEAKLQCRSDTSQNTPGSCNSLHTIITLQYHNKQYCKVRNKLIK